MVAKFLVESRKNVKIAKNQIRFGSGFTNRSYIKEIGVYSYTAGIRSKKCVGIIQLQMIKPGCERRNLTKLITKSLKFLTNKINRKITLSDSVTIMIHEKL